MDLLDNFSRGRHDADLQELLDHDSAGLIECDLLRPGALDELGGDYEVIVHLAAIVGVANVMRSPQRVLEDNVELLLSLLRFAERQPKLNRFVFASTSEAYAGTMEAFGVPVPTPEDVPLTLPDVGRPRSSYMLSKIYGEALCIHSGLPYTVVRPHNFYGPRMGMSHVIPELLKRAHEAEEGSSLEVYSVDHRRTFCFIEDAVAMLGNAALSRECEGEVLNVGAEAPEVRIGELAAKVAGTVGKHLQVTPLPATPGSPERRCPDTAKVRRLTGVSPEVSLDEGLRRTYAWYQSTFGDPSASDASAPAGRTST